MTRSPLPDNLTPWQRATTALYHDDADKLTHRHHVYIGEKPAPAMPVVIPEHSQAMDDTM